MLHQPSSSPGSLHPSFSCRSSSFLGAQSPTSFILNPPSPCSTYPDILSEMFNPNCSSAQLKVSPSWWRLSTCKPVHCKCIIFYCIQGEKQSSVCKYVHFLLPSILSWDFLVQIRWQRILFLVSFLVLLAYSSSLESLSQPGLSGSQVIVPSCKCPFTVHLALGVSDLTEIVATGRFL